MLCKDSTACATTGPPSSVRTVADGGSASGVEMWEVKDVDVHHDDPAGATPQWEIVGEGGQTLVLTIGAVAINVHTKLSDYYATPFWIGPEWIVRIRAAGALAGGQKFYEC